MKRQQFLQSKSLKLSLLKMQKKLMQLHHRFIIQVVSDTRVDQVSKTFRQWQYFNKIIQLHKKIGLKDRQLILEKHIRSSNKFKQLEIYIQRLNSGYLLYKSANDLESRRNADSDFFSKNLSADIMMLEPVKTRQLRSYLYDLLFREDQLFVDGVDSDSFDQVSPDKQVPFNKQKSLKTEFVKQQVFESPKKQEKSSKNPIKNFFQNRQVQKALQKISGTKVGGSVMNQIQRTEVNINQAIKTAKSQRQKSSSMGKLKKAFLQLTSKARPFKPQPLPSYNTQSKNLKSILKSLTKCYLKFPNNYITRDRNVVYKPFIWEEYELKLQDNQLQFTNYKQKHQKVYVIFQCDVELNFQEYTKLIVRNKVDKTSLEIRFGLDQNNILTEGYLALYTYIKEIIKEQQDKLKITMPQQKNNKVCNKMRIRIGLKQKMQRTASINGSQASKKSNANQLPQAQQLKPTATLEIPMGKTIKPGPVLPPGSSIPQMNQPSPQPQSPTFSPRGSQLQLHLPHLQPTNDQKQQLQFKEIKQPPINLKQVCIRLQHCSIATQVTIAVDSYVDIDFPILDNFGALQIKVIDDTARDSQNAFLSIGQKDKQLLCQFHVPIQTIYDYMYNIQRNLTLKPRKQVELKTKMIEIKHTKVNLTFDYKHIGNFASLYAYNDNDIFEDDQPPEEFTRDEFRMNNNRLKRIIWSIQLYVERFKDLKNFTYPNFSYLFFGMLAVSCLFFDNNNFLFWFLVSLLAVMFYNSPVYGVYIRDLVDILKFKAKKKKLDTILFKKNKLIQEQYVIPSKKVAKQQFLAQFQLTRKIKRSIYKKYKRLLEVLLQAQILLTKLVSMIQKIKNIFIWYHYKKTKLLFIFICIMVFALLVIPVRLIMFAIILKAMQKGSKYHARVQDINRIIIIQLIRVIIRQNNLAFMQTFFKQLYRPFEFQNPQTFAFFKISKSCISDWLQVTISMDQLIRKSTNMQQFITNLSKCKTYYTIRRDVCIEYGFSTQWSKHESSGKRLFGIIFGFIVSVPSDKYIMGVRTVQGGDEEVEEADNIIDRELLNF